MSVSVVDRLRAQVDEQRISRQSMGDALHATGAMKVVQQGFLAVPPLELLVEEENERLALDVVKFSDKFMKIFHRHVERNGASGITDAVDWGIAKLSSISNRRGGSRYRDIGVLYGQVLGPVTILVKTSGVDWDKVWEVERMAFDGVYRPRLWWPEWRAEDFVRRSAVFLENCQGAYPIEPGSPRWVEFSDYVQANPSLLSDLRVEDRTLHDALLEALAEGTDDSTGEESR